MNGRDSLGYTSPDPEHQCILKGQKKWFVESTRRKIFSPRAGFLCVFVPSLKHKKRRWRSLVTLCTSKHKAAQATALRWLLDISCDVRICSGGITWASCASSAPYQAEQGHGVFQPAQSARGVPAGLISWQHFQQFFQWLLPLVMLGAWEHTQAELPLHLFELPWDSDSPHCIFKTSGPSFLLFPLSVRELHNGSERNAVPWQPWRAISRFCVSAHICHHTLPFQYSFPAFHFN